LAAEATVSSEGGLALEIFAVDLLAILLEKMDLARCFGDLGEGGVGRDVMGE
jgi:hypothetical protein